MNRYKIHNLAATAGGRILGPSIDGGFLRVRSMSMTVQGDKDLYMLNLLCMSPGYSIQDAFTYSHIIGDGVNPVKEFKIQTINMDADIGNGLQAVYGVLAGTLYFADINYVIEEMTC